MYHNIVDVLAPSERDQHYNITDTRYISISQVTLNSGHGNLYLKEVRIWYYNVASNLSLVIPGNTQWSPVTNSNLQEWHQ